MTLVLILSGITLLVLLAVVVAAVMSTVAQAKKTAQSLQILSAHLNNSKENVMRIASAVSLIQIHDREWPGLAGRLGAGQPAFARALVSWSSSSSVL